MRILVTAIEDTLNIFTMANIHDVTGMGTATNVPAPTAIMMKMMVVMMMTTVL